jgi:hypothetical protein
MNQISLPEWSKKGLLKIAGTLHCPEYFEDCKHRFGHCEGSMCEKLTNANEDLSWCPFVGRGAYRLEQIRNAIIIEEVF